ncbi:MAG: c-type cytochrome [Burkholderiales bacterium]|nr:c-type cytochrome [Burkholderiales bacterium]
MASVKAAPAANYAERFAAVCAACHGADGRSTMALTPSLAGQPSFYAITQLFLFRDGRRQGGEMSALMTAIAKPMTDDDLRGFSDFIGKLPPLAPATPPTIDATRAELRCASCHGGDYAGGKQVPRLAGQREDYLLHALRGFRAATRLGYTSAMSEALAGTSPEALEDLAHYIASVASP